MQTRLRALLLQWVWQVRQASRTPGLLQCCRLCASCSTTLTLKALLHCSHHCFACSKMIRSVVPQSAFTCPTHVCGVLVASGPGWTQWALVVFWSVCFGQILHKMLQSCEGQKGPLACMALVLWAEAHAVYCSRQENIGLSRSSCCT